MAYGCQTPSAQRRSDQFKIVSDSEMGKIWLPLLDITYDNAVIAETIKEEFYSLGDIIKSKADERFASALKESLIYPGARNPFLIKIKYYCLFFCPELPF